MKKYNDVSYQELFREYLTEKDVFLEELILQSNKLNSINESTVNTVRCQTIKTDEGVRIPWCFAKLGRAGFFIDNGGAGGLLASIDVKTGIIESDAVDELGQRYSVHPDSGITIRGFKYPDWDQLISICTEMALQVKSAKWIGWDMAHTESGWVVVEGNSVTEVIGPQSTQKRGIKQLLDSYLRRTKVLF